MAKPGELQSLRRQSRTGLFYGPVQGEFRKSWVVGWLAPARRCTSQEPCSTDLTILPVCEDPHRSFNSESLSYIPQTAQEIGVKCQRAVFSGQTFEPLLVTSRHVASLHLMLRCFQRQCRQLASSTAKHSLWQVRQSTKGAKVDTEKGTPSSFEPEPTITVQ